MTTPGSNETHAQVTANHIKRAKGGNQNVWQSIWSWLNSTAGGIGRVITGPISLAFTAAADWARVVAAFWVTLWHGLESMGVQIALALRYYIHGLLGAYFRRIYAYILRTKRDILRTVVALFWLDHDFTKQQVGYERIARKREVKRAEHLARVWDKALHRDIEHEAVSGYRLGYTGRISEITKIADLIANYNPVTRKLVGDLVTGILDLATVEDPVLRLALGFIMKHIIDRLGLDKVVGQFLDSLLAPILGEPKPKDLHDVIYDISQRIGALEGQWSTFFADGGADVEQAGKEWQAITSPIADVALTAWFAQAILEPNAWAADINGTIGRLATDTVSGIARLIKG